MSEKLQKEIIRSIGEAQHLYHRLVLLVAPSGSGKTAVLQEVAAGLNRNLINTNLAVSKELLEFTAKQRILRLPEILLDLLGNEPSPILLDNTEILFARELKQDPLRLLKNLSRNKVVVASWNGTIQNDKLFYAKPGHDEYRCYEPGDISVVTMEGM